jgi:hypothetical protein
VLEGWLRGDKGLEEIAQMFERERDTERRRAEQMAAQLRALGLEPPT